MFKFDGLSRLRELVPENQRVLVRADLDCPMTNDGHIADHTQLDAALPSIRYLLEHKARVIVAAHQTAVGSDGIPLSMEACGAYFAERLGCDVLLPDDHDGPMARKLILEQREGTLVLLENLARDPRESDGDDGLAHALAKGVDLYVGDCLQASATAASVATLPRLCRDRTLGIHVERELTVVQELLDIAPSDLLVVLGGDFTASAPLRRWALRRGAKIAVAGPLAATVAAGKGINLGRTTVDTSLFAEVRTWLEHAQRQGATVILPKDVYVTGDHVSNTPTLRPLERVGKGERLLDLGPESIEQIGERAKQAKAVLLVGNLGFSQHSNQATTDILRLIAATDTLSVAVHGSLDTRLLRTSEALEAARDSGDFDGGLPSLSFVSTAGNTLQDVLSGRRVAIVENLRSSE
jgi:phosphoglycerate kinase